MEKYIEVSWGDLHESLLGNQSLAEYIILSSYEELKEGHTLCISYDASWHSKIKEIVSKLPSGKNFMLFPKVTVSMPISYEEFKAQCREVCKDFSKEVFPVGNVVPYFHLLDGMEKDLETLEEYEKLLKEEHGEDMGLFKMLN